MYKRNIGISLAVFFAILFTFQNSYGQNNSKLPTLKAIHRPDNSFVTDNDSPGFKEPLPLIVEKKINKLQKKNNTDEFNAKSIIRPVVFRIDYSQDIRIYAVKLYSTDRVSYYFIAFNVISKTITHEPPTINGKWMENHESGFDKNDRMLVYPLIYFQDLNHDGEKDIIIKERVHNGSMYDAVVEHIYSLDNMMTFHLILCIESKYRYPLNNCVVNRSLENNILKSELVCNNKTTDIGSVKLKLKGTNKIIDKKCYQTEYENLLITGSNTSEEYFLKFGYNFKY